MSKGFRCEGRFLRCFWLSREEGGILVGFTVPSRNFSSVQRNRLKRIMKAGFVKARHPLQGIHSDIVLLYKGSPDLQINQVRLEDILDDIAALLTAAKKRCQVLPKM